MNQLREIYNGGDDTELMKMAIRMPDALKLNDEIDENDWTEIQTVIEEAVLNILTFRRDEGMSLEKEFTTYRKHSSA
jgi:uncharacterized protein YicC (UPF0701 family)